MALRVVGFFAVTLRETAFLATVFFAVALPAVGFFAVALRVAAFLATVFFAVALRLAGFIAAAGFFLRSDLVAIIWPLLIVSIRAPGCSGSTETKTAVSGYG